MAYGRRKSVGQYRKAGHAANKKNQTCTRITTHPSSQRWITKKNNKSSTISSLPTITRTSTTNHFQPAPIDNIVFNRTEFGTPRKDFSGKASSMAKSREVKKVKDVILNPNLTSEQQSLTLHSVLKDPELSSIIKDAGISISSSTENVAKFHAKQTNRILKFALTTNEVKGRTTNERRAFVMSNLVGMANSPTKKSFSPSRRQRIKAVGIPLSTGFRRLKDADETRTMLLTTKINENNILWSSVKSRKGYSKVSIELRKKLFDWIIKHPDIVDSPLSNDTILIKNPSNSNEKIRVGKLLRNISIRELHNDLLSKPPIGLAEVYDTEGNCLISDTSLNSLMPPHVKKMSNKYKMMCGCEICILIKGMQKDLNAYRLILMKLNESKKSKIAKRKAKLYKKMFMTIMNIFIHIQKEHCYVFNVP